MGAVRGTAARVFINQFNLSTSLNEAAQSAEQEEIDVSVFESSGFRDFVAGFRGGTFNVSGFFTYSNSTGAQNESDNVLDSLVSSTDNPVITYVVGGDTIGGNTQLFEGVETSYEVTASVGEAVGVAAAFRDSNGPAFGQVLHTHVASTSTGAGTSVDSGFVAGTAGGGIAHLHVTAFSTDATSTAADRFIIKVQHSSNNSVWADLITFSTVTGITYQRSTSAATVKRYVREIRTVAVGSATYELSFARNNR